MEHAHTSPTPPSPRPRLLVIDDEIVQRDCLSRALPRWGYAVTTVGSAEEALQLLRREPFELVISDIKMPGTSGLELLRQIKQEWPALNVILVSGYVTEDSAESALLSGAFEYIPKPYLIEHLTAVIQKALLAAKNRKHSDPRDKAA